MFDETQDYASAPIFHSHRVDYAWGWWILTQETLCQLVGIYAWSIWYSWKSFFKIFCNVACQRPSFRDRLLRDFLGLLPTESLIASAFSGHPAVNFLSDLRFSAFLLRLFTDHWPSGLKFVYPTINLAFPGIIVQFKLLGKFGWHSLEWFCRQISDVKYFSSLVQGMVIDINSCYSILFSNLK